MGTWESHWCWLTPSQAATQEKQTCFCTRSTRSMQPWGWTPAQLGVYLQPKNSQQHKYMQISWNFIPLDVSFGNKVCLGFFGTQRGRWMASEVTAWIQFWIFLYSCDPQENFMKLSFPFCFQKLSFTTALGEHSPQSIPWISTHLRLQGSLQLIHHPNKLCCRVQYGIFHHPPSVERWLLGLDGKK